MTNEKWELYERLCELGLKEKPAWIKKLVAWEYTKSEILEIIKYEDWQMVINKNAKEMERNLKELLRNRERELVKEMLNEKPEWVKESKIRYFNEKITELEEQIKIIYEDNFLLRNEKVTLWFRQCLMGLKGLNRLEKDLRGAKMRLRIARFGSNDNDITPEMIEEARKYPIDKIIEVKRNKAICLWHLDKHPSMHIYAKKNNAFCFTCNTYHDSIDIFMKKNDVNFVEAIKFLSRG